MSADISTADPLALELVAPLPSAPKHPDRDKRYSGTAEAAAARLGLSRRPFFRWLDHAREHADPLPCDDPPSVLPWYERMRARGVFKHRSPPAAVLKACQPTAPQTPPAHHPHKPSPALPSHTDASFPIESTGAAAIIDSVERSVLFFAEQETKLRAEAAAITGTDEPSLERRTMLLREAEQAKARLDKEHEKWRKLKKDSAVLISEDDRPRKEWVAEDLAAIVPPAIATWLSAGAKFHRESKSALSRPEFTKLWRAYIADFLRSLAQSRFAPPLILDEAA